MADTVSKVLFLIVVVLVLIMFINLFVNKDEKPNDEIILGKITESSELTTAKIEFTGYSEHNNDGTFLINKSKFKMIYDATARIGFEVDDVVVKSNHATKVVNVSIPEPGVLEVHVDGSSLKFFDENFAFFKNDKVETGKAIAAAEDASKIKLADMGVIDMAKKQAEEIIKGLISEAVPKGYKIKVEFIEKK